MKIKYKNKGILIWITGLSGAGKTSLAKGIKNKIAKSYGKTIILNGDDLREIFDLNRYDRKARLNYGRKYCKFLKFLTDQNVNVIFTVVGLFDELRNWNRKNIKNYVEVYVKAQISDIKRKKKKKVYYKKNQSLVGIQISPEFPKKPDIIIKNDFKKTIQSLSLSLVKKIALL